MIRAALLLRLALRDGCYRTVPKTWCAERGGEREYRYTVLYCTLIHLTSEDFDKGSRIIPVGQETIKMKNPKLKHGSPV